MQVTDSRVFHLSYTVGDIPAGLGLDNSRGPLTAPIVRTGGRNLRYHPCRDAQSDAAMRSLVSTIALLLLPTVSSLLLPVASTVPRALTLRLPFASTVPPAVTPRTMVTMQEPCQFPPVVIMIVDAVMRLTLSSCPASK